ncbi:hypothetical protein OO7_06184 [Providencia sneebia DSM 19967]|uniref:Uncharacterized protein n=1 Tax=Providencia sneebia DSM 19967 TaxID=1141660 RepID=K8WLC8_9GAMM|nr:hypothetical protein OO7_06184 [Providencia sneebia DSM 19967]
MVLAATYPIEKQSCGLDIDVVDFSVVIASVIKIKEYDLFYERVLNISKYFSKYDLKRLVLLCVVMKFINILLGFFNHYGLITTLILIKFNSITKIKNLYCSRIIITSKIRARRCVTGSSRHKPE